MNGKTVGDIAGSAFRKTRRRLIFVDADSEAALKNRTIGPIRIQNKTKRASP
jgi:hypothetical protein